MPFKRPLKPILAVPHSTVFLSGDTSERQPSRFFHFLWKFTPSGVPDLGYGQEIEGIDHLCLPLHHNIGWIRTQVQRAKCVIIAYLNYFWIDICILPLIITDPKSATLFALNL